MDGLGPALFGLFLVSFTVSKPVSLFHQQTLPSSESSESNEPSSSEEVAAPGTTLQPLEQNTMIADSLEDELLQTNNHTEPPDLTQTASPSVFTEQIVVEVEVNVNQSLSPLLPAVPVTIAPEAQRIVIPEFTTQEVRCYTVPVTSPAPKPVRGDDI